jgi:hypothetical protein
MTKEEIHVEFDKMLSNPKAKTFLNHLVRSYMPVTQIEKVWDKPKGDFKCVITKEPLISVQEVFEGIHTEEFKNDMMNHIKTMFKEDNKIDSPMAKLLGDKKLGFTGKDTTTFMSYEVAQEFYNWIITKSLKGDKHINWLLGSIRRTTFMKRAEKIQDKTVQTKVENFKKANETSAKFTLGDANDVLSKLKAQLESNGQ